MRGIIGDHSHLWILDNFTDHFIRLTGSELVLRAVGVMKEHKCEEAVLETEVTNLGAIRLYTNLGFLKDKLLASYYMNGSDAWRLKLWLAYDDDKKEEKPWLF